jgi:hypothetical protein
MDNDKMSPYEKYIKIISGALEEKRNLSNYKYLDSCIEIYNAYEKEITKIKNHKVISRSKSKTNVFKILFNSSLIYFNELKNDIVLSNYTSAYCILRIIIENYIIITFLYKNKSMFSRKYYNFSNVALLKIIKNYSKQISKESKRKILKNYRKIKLGIDFDYNNLSNSLRSNFGTNAKDLLEKNNYG